MARLRLFAWTLMASLAREVFHHIHALRLRNIPKSLLLHSIYHKYSQVSHRKACSIKSTLRAFQRFGLWSVRGVEVSSQVTGQTQHPFAQALLTGRFSSCVILLGNNILPPLCAALLMAHPCLIRKHSKVDLRSRKLVKLSRSLSSDKFYPIPYSLNYQLSSCRNLPTLWTWTWRRAFSHRLLYCLLQQSATSSARAKMPVELRKRKAVEPAPAAPANKKSSIAKVAKKVVTAISGKSTNSPKAPSAISVGDTVSLEDFGGEVTTNGGEATSLKDLVEKSSAGVVLFTYVRSLYLWGLLYCKS